MEDLNKLSFSISGDSTKATTSIETLISSIRRLGSTFDDVYKSGMAFSTTLKEIANSVKASNATIQNSKVQLNGMQLALNKVKVSNKATTASMKASSSALKQMNASLKQTKTVSNGSTGAINKSTSALKKNATAGKTSIFTNKSHTLSLNALVRKMAQLTFVVYTLRKALDAISMGTQKAIAYVENLNLFMVALSTNTLRASAFITEMSTSMYLDEAQLTRVQGLFYQISESLGLTSEKAYTLSENFTKLAYDLASFYNINVDDAITKLQAGLVGETEPLRRLGVILTENNLTETARNLGIKKSIRNMTEQEKIQLRYITLLQQTQNAQGDLARTMLQPENLLRIMHEQFSKLARELGNAFIPMLQKVVPEVIGLTIALTKMAKAFAITAGYKPPVMSNDMGGYQKVVEDITDETDTTAKNTAKISSNIYSALKYTKALSNATTGIDELNVLGSSSSVSVTPFATMYPTSTAVSSVTDAIDMALGSYDNNMSAVDGVFDQIVAKWETRIADIKGAFTGIFDSAIEAFNKLYTQLFGDTKDLTTLDKVYNSLLFINDMITGILRGVSDVVGVFQWLWIDGIKPIMDAVAPSWLNAMSDGSLIDVVEKLTVMFIAWKALKFGVGIATVVSGAGGSMGLAGLVIALGAIKLGIDMSKAINTGDFLTIGTEMKNAIATGLGVGFLTGNPVLGALAFSVVALLDLDLGETWNNVLTSAVQKVEDGVLRIQEALKKLKEALGWKSKDDTQPSITSFSKVMTPLQVGGDVGTIAPIDKNESVVTSAVNMFDSIGNGIAYMFTGGLFGRPFGINSFAKGGTPQKGSLFIAGEAGAELVGDLGNGGTSVVNKKQMKTLGIPQYARGVNVPAWTPEEQNASKYTKASDTSSFSITKQMDSVVEDIGDAFKGFFKFIKVDFVKAKVSDAYKASANSLKDTFNRLKLQSSTVWKGITDSKAYKGLSDAFKSLSKGVGIAYNVFKGATKGIGKVTLSLFESFKSTDVQAIMKDVPSNGGSTIQQQSVMGDVVGQMLSGTPMGMIFDVMQGISSGMIGSFIETLPQFIQSGIDMLLALVKGVVKALPALLAMIPDVITEIVGMLTDGETINVLINGVIMAVVEIVKALPDIIVALIKAIPTIVMALINAFVDNIGLFAKLGIFIGLSILDGIGNILISGINLLIKGINYVIPGSRWDIPMIPKMNTASIVGFADGGYPTQGRMFIAGEAGAELIGNIGGRTSVMNNDQIVESVSNGVYEAVARALAGSSNKETVINLDGKRVSTGLTVSKRSIGASYGTGGF